LNVYFECDEKDVKLECLDDPKQAFEEIEEEEEDIGEADPNLKEFLGLK
jgi:hypothetical protein